MEELLKAMGYKDPDDMNLDEVRRQTEDYTHFLESLDEISEALEINTGTYMELEYMYDFNKETIEQDYSNKWKYNQRFYERNPQVLANVLLAMVMRAHAKMGEIAFMLENDVENLYEREAQILDDMEQSQIADSENCEYCGGNCDDCYIQGCCSSACER